MNALQNVTDLVGKVAGIPQVSDHPVHAVCWDITLGVAGTALGHFFLGATSSSTDNVPDAVDHVGIIVYGYLYEYGDLGILRSLVPLHETPKSKYPVFSLRSREDVGKTPKLFEEFEAWVNEMNAENFRGSKYDLVERSCVSWGREACQFLEVPYPENWDKICDWVKQNRTLATLVGGSGVTSRKVQFRAQAAAAPRRLKNWLLRKILCRSDEPTQSS